MSTRTLSRSAPAARTGPPVIDIYARISRSTDKTRGRKVSDQVADGVADITARGGVVGEVFRDESLSAWDPKVDRPDFNLLMARLESGISHGVWVWELTRFTRKVLDGERLLEAARSGALVWSDDTEHNLTKAAGRRAFREAMVAAAGESDTISERSSRGKEKKAMRGRSNASIRGFAMPGYLPNPPGWEPGQPRTVAPAEQVAAEREALRRVVDDLLAGATWAQVLDHLNGAGHRTYQGRPWTAVSLRHSLRRPALAGIAEHLGREVGTLEGEPVLDRSTWDRLQSHLDARKRGRPTSPAYLLAGLLVCGRSECGGRLTGRPRVSRRPYPDGSVAREYWCQKRDDGTGCGRLAVDQRFADEVVTRMALEVLSDPEHADAQARTAQAIDAARVEVAAERARITADLDSLADKVAAWGVERVDRAMRPLLHAQAALDAREKALDAGEPTGTPVAPWAAVAEWKQAGTTGRRRMLRQAFPAGLAVDPSTSRGVGARYDRDRFRVLEG